jgi:hypothetical protein
MTVSYTNLRDSQRRQCDIACEHATYPRALITTTEAFELTPSVVRHTELVCTPASHGALIARSVGLVSHDAAEFGLLFSRLFELIAIAYSNAFWDNNSNKTDSRSSTLRMMRIRR